MSAFMVSTTHIDAMLTAGLAYGTAGGPLYWYWADPAHVNPAAARLRLAGCVGASANVTGAPTHEVLVHDASVGVLYDYFAASTDDAAAATINLPGGPGGAEPYSPELVAAMRSGDREAMRQLMQPKVRISEYGFPVLSVKGIDPVVQLGTLEALLTDVPYDDIMARDRSGHAVAVQGEGERFVVTLSDEFRDSLALATDEQLVSAAEPWSQTEEFRGQGEPDALAYFLRQLAQLARDATSAGDRVYCWVCI